MNKVYLLLRNNNKTGPHSLEELIQLGLKPMDLVWVEGKSFSWSYPSEISTLKPYVVQSNQSAVTNAAVKEHAAVSSDDSANTHQAYMPPKPEIPSQPAGPAAKRVYVSMPGNTVQNPVAEPEKSVVPDLENKADEIRKRTQAYAAGNKPHSNNIIPAVPESKSVSSNKKSTAKESKPAGDDFVQTKYSRAVGELEEDYSSWIYNQKSKKKKNPAWGGIVMAVAAVLLLGAGFGISRYDSTEPETVSQVEPETQQLTEKDVSNDQALIPLPSPPAVELPQTVNHNEALSTGTVEQVKNDNKSHAVNLPASTPVKKEPKIPASQQVTKSSSGSLPSSKTVEAEKQKSNVPVENTANKAISKSKEQTTETTPVAPEKKKTFGAALSGFFGKFKKKVDAVHDAGEEPIKQEDKSQDNKAGRQVEKPQTTTQEPGTERKAKRRSEEPGAGETISTPAIGVKTNFEDYVDLSSNEQAEKWMLGVHGLRLTMHNKSSETLRTAAVEVRYYSEQNELLDKKIINFSNVPPSKSVTLAIPDHRLADHTSYRFLSANN